jgi:hypothetical protein
VSLPKPKPKPKRNPETSNPARAWRVRFEAPTGPGGKRRQPYAYGATSKACTEAMIATLGQIQAGTFADDRKARFGDHLTRQLAWWESEGALKSIDSYREAIELYLRPAYGHLRLADVRDPGLGRDLAAAMRKINRPEADADSSELLRRLLAARAVRDGKRISTRPLTGARITRVLAVGSSACASLVPGSLWSTRSPGPGLGRRGRSGRCCGRHLGWNAGGRRARFLLRSWCGPASSAGRS